MIYQYKCENGHIEDIEHDMNAVMAFSCKKCNKPMIKDFSSVSVSSGDLDSKNVRR